MEYPFFLICFYNALDKITIAIKLFFFISHFCKDNLIHPFFSQSQSIWLRCLCAVSCWLCCVCGALGRQTKGSPLNKIKTSVLFIYFYFLLPPLLAAFEWRFVVSRPNRPVNVFSHSLVDSSLLCVGPIRLTFHFFIQKLFRSSIQ